MTLIEKVYSLRKLVCEYRLSKTNQSEISSHVNAVDMVTSLLELAIIDKRPISKEEQNWFKAGLYLDYIFANSQFENILIVYNDLVQETKKLNFFKS